MRLIKFEFMKIWRPRVLLALLALSLAFGYMFLSFPLQHFPNGHPDTESYSLMEHWTEKYGTTMDETEYADAVLEKSELENEINLFIKANGQFSNAGIQSYDEWCVINLKETDWTENELAASRVYYSADSKWLGYRIAILENALNAYDVRYNELEATDKQYTATEQVRISDLISGNKLDGIMPYVVIDNLQEYSQWGITFILLSVLILLVPTITRDRLVNLRQLQWSSKCGRKILNAQFMAMMFSVIVLVVIELVVLIAAYSTLGTQAFWESPINSFFHSGIYWFGLTYGQYVWCILGIVGLLSIGTMGFTFVLSRYSGNYIALLFKTVPIFVLLALLTNGVISNLFSFNNILSTLTGIVGIEFMCAFTVFFISMLLCAAVLRREKYCELS